MLIQTVVYTVDPADVEAMLQTVRALRDASRGEPGCGAFDVVQIGDGTTFVLHEEWKDQAALDFHYGTEHFQRYGTNGVRKLAKTRSAYTGIPLD